MKHQEKSFVPTMLFLIGVLLLAGCGSVSHRVTMEQGYVPQPGTKIQVGEVTNNTAQTFDIEIEKMLAEAMTTALQQEKLLLTDSSAPKLTLYTKITEYDKGDAFKRWVMPGWGSTVLAIQADLMGANNQVVGSVKAMRTVSFGGAFTIGAWKSVFDNLAKDVVTDLVKQLGVVGVVSSFHSRV